MTGKNILKYERLYKKVTLKYEKYLNITEACSKSNTTAKHYYKICKILGKPSVASKTEKNAERIRKKTIIQKGGERNYDKLIKEVIEQSGDEDYKEHRRNERELNKTQRGGYLEKKLDLIYNVQGTTSADSWSKLEEFKKQYT